LVVLHCGCFEDLIIKADGGKRIRFSDEIGFN
jgi:hypothetical protein